jgi:nicotinamide phosphoribosyltransferase
MVHDFGYRGVSSEESAALGGAAHLLNFKGTDTIAGMALMHDYYGFGYHNLAHSVRASEHSIMTLNGPKGEIDIASRIIAQSSNKIVSVVGDSYDYPNFVAKMIGLKELVRTNNDNLVIRPDSVTPQQKTPAEVVLWTLRELVSGLGTTTTNGGLKTMYKVLYGDGLEPQDIKDITDTVQNAGFDPFACCVFGMGGGLLQKVNRDTFGFALKACAYSDGNEWIPVSKNPLDKSKQSRAGDQTYGLPKVFSNGMILSAPEPDTLRSC